MRKEIPLFKVLMDPDVPSRLMEVLFSGYIAQGGVVDDFEKSLESIIGVRPIAVNSGTSALDLAMHLVGAKPGAEIITTPQTCLATNSPAVVRGARLVYADVDPITGNIDPESVADRISGHTRAVITVDWAGRPCNYDVLRRVVEDIPIVEDAAHALGATYKGKPLAMMGGDLLCYSFQAIKHLTCGDGGALAANTNKFRWRTRARLLRWYGLDRDVPEPFVNCSVKKAGYKYNMNNIAAAIGLGNLRAAIRAVAMHKDNALYYCQHITNPLITVPEYCGDSSYWLFTIHSPDKIRNDLIKFLHSYNIMAGLAHSRNDIHPAFSFYSGKLQGVDYFNSTQLNIPVGWWVTKEDREYIVTVLNNWRG